MTKSKHWRWNEFEEKEPPPGAKMKRMACIHCKKEAAPNVSRMKNHLRSCRKAKEALGRDRILSVEGPSNIASQSPAPSSPPEASVGGRSSAMSSMLSYARIDPWTREQQAQAEAQLARCVNIDCASFSMFEKPHWAKHHSILRAGYKIPSRRKLGDELLKNDFQSMLGEEQAFCKSAKHFGIAVDGWADLKGRNFSAVMLNHPLPLFLKSVGLTCQSEDEAAIVNIIGGARRDIGMEAEPEAGAAPLSGKERLVGARLFGMVTDSPPVMTAARESCIKKGMIEVAYGCASHALNNHASDTLKWKGQHLQDCLAVIRALKGKKSKKEARALFKEKQIEFGCKRELAFFTATRWTSAAGMMGSILLSKTAIQNLLLDDRLAADTFDDDLKAKLTRGFWKSHEDLTKVIKSAAAACALVEADNAALSAYAGVFAWLAAQMMDFNFKSIGGGDRMMLVKMLRRRLFGWVDPRDRRRRVARPFDPCLALALMVDPFCENLRLRVAQKFGSLRLGLPEWISAGASEGEGEEAAEDIGSLAMLCLRNSAAKGDQSFGAALLDSWSQLRRKAGAFRSGGMLDSTARDMHPINAFAGGVELEAVSSVAVALLSLSCSAGGAERQFKARSRVSRKERLNLGKEKIDMQSIISFNSMQLRRSSSHLAERRVGGMHKILSQKPDDAVEIIEISNVEDLFDSWCDDVGIPLDDYEDYDVEEALIALRED